MANGGVAAAGVLFFLAACSEEGREIERLTSPDENAVAIYRVLQLGNATESASHCISIVAAEDADDQDPDCNLLARSISSPGLAWKGDVLELEYYDAEITKIENWVFVDLPSGKEKLYRLANVVNPLLGGVVCNDNFGPACPVGQYCQPEEGGCGFPDISGTCQVKGAACTKEYRPVCSCGGITYGNPCEAASAGDTIAYRGPCKK